MEIIIWNNNNGNNKKEKKQNKRTIFETTFTKRVNSITLHCTIVCSIMIGEFYDCQKEEKYYF